MESNQAPLLSVLVPTHGRPDRIQSLIARLSKQSAPMDSFEVIVVDDGGDPPVSIDVRQLPFSCTVLQRRNAGPAAARNAGLAMVGAPLVLILNDDAVPAPDLIQRHLEAHENSDGKTAVLGTFHFTEESRQSPFVRVLDETDHLFAFKGLAHGKRYGWTHFWTCNISLPMQLLLEVGGFDEERFDKAICEDVELGLRLERLGVSVLYNDRCVAHHEHTLTPTSYQARSFTLGIYQTRLQEKHGEPAKTDNQRATDAQQALRVVESKLASADRFFAQLESDERSYAGKELPNGYVAKIDAALTEHFEPYRAAGIYAELTGTDPLPLVRDGAPAGTTVAAVIVSCNALANTQRCIQSLRAAVTDRYPMSLVVVDNGSTDGSAEWLSDQPDIELILNPDNFGAPRARNQGIQRVAPGTDWIAFLDNDVFVPKGWLERALYHGAIDDAVGSIALCANRASKLQVLPYDGPSDPASIDQFAARHAESAPRAGDDATLFTSLGVLVRGEVMDAIGGFDEAFSPWGFEDDDLALRIRLSGFRNRVAKDTFVFHASYDGPVKEQQHAAWLHQNWEAFLGKWSPSALGSQLFDYNRVVLPQLGEATPAQIVFPLPAAGAAPPTWPGKTAPGQLEPEAADASLPSRELAPTAPPQATTARSTGGDRANVLVMGCGRSGTSMVTGMLADAGWNVGDRPYAGRPANPKGFFETAEINGINEYLLGEATPNETPLGRMQHWLAYASDPLTFEVDGSIRGRMDRLAERGPFAYKDPRFCYTLPAWRPSMANAKFVCIFREPAHSAASIMKEVGQEAYLDGCGVDFERAVDVWNAMYRQVLDVHSQDGEWLFLHFDQLFTPEGVQRLEAFVGAPVAADFPERGLKRSASNEPVPSAVADTFRELCERAGAQPPAIAATPEPVAVTTVQDPELTVLICSYQRRETLLRCLASFENQTAAGRYEIVLVNDGATDGTKEALDAWSPKAPLNVIHRENGGLAAARNTGLEQARGRYVLFVNDDTIAAPDLVEQHLLAHAKHGPGRAILGTFEQPREALDNALMRVIEETTMVFCYAGLDPNQLHDWNRFWTCNVSVSLDDVKSIGMFDVDFRHYGCEDTDLAYRLHTECGTRVIYAPEARATHEHILTFEDLKRRSRTVASAYVRFFHKHPETMTHPFWKGRTSLQVRAKDDMIVQTLFERAQAEAMAAELSSINVGVIERAGAEGIEIAGAITLRLKQYLVELNNLWWSDGEVEATAKGIGTVQPKESPEPVAVG